MKSKSIGFDASFFVGNRKALKKNIKLDLAVISANGLLQKSLDAAFPFRQDSNFWYLTGLNEPSLILVLDGSDEYLILPKISEYMQVFDGGIDKKSLQEISGIKNVYDHESGWKRLTRKLEKVSEVGVLAAAQAYVSELDMYTNPARGFLIERLSEVDPHLPQIDIRKVLADLRLVKKAPEIAAIRRATNLTMQAFEAMSDGLVTADNENQLERIATITFVQHGQENAYSPIVAAGKNATTLHYVANDSSIQEGELILIDIGASDGMYASDLTRTIGVEPTKRQQQVHRAVLEILERSKKLIKPGITVRDMEIKVRRMIAEKLVELKLIDSIESDKIRQFYPHSATHFVGLDVHDPTPHDAVLEPGMVLTIEPGIYIEKEAIGVRIEDIVLVTAGGNEVLSAPLSRGVTSLTIESKQ